MPVVGACFVRGRSKDGLHPSFVGRVTDQLAGGGRLMKQSLAAKQNRVREDCTFLAFFDTCFSNIPAG